MTLFSCQKVTYVGVYTVLAIGNIKALVKYYANPCMRRIVPYLPLPSPTKNSGMNNEHAVLNIRNVMALIDSIEARGL